MASNRLIRSVIVICLLSATVVLGGCSPPLPKTWLPPPGGTMYDIHVSGDRLHPADAPALRTKEAVGLSRTVQDPQAGCGETILAPVALGERDVCGDCR
jgi:hypothetical protein